MKISLLLALPLLIGANISDRREIAIIGLDPRNPASGRALLPHVAPIVYVRQTQGAALPEKGPLNGCAWHEEKHEHPVVVGVCDDGVEVVITGLDLNY